MPSFQQSFPLCSIVKFSMDLRDRSRGVNYIFSFLSQEPRKAHIEI